jgi:type IV pilus assembly protein PilC
MASAVLDAALRRRQNRPQSAATGRAGARSAAFVRTLGELSFTRFSTKDRTLFAKRLSFLIKAGVPVVECLHLIRKQTSSKGKARVYDSVISDLANGQFLATALGKFRHHFGDFTINLIRVGESSGILSQNLNYLADELQKKHALQRKVRSALVYPIFITLATLGVTSLLTVFIFPKIMPIFVSLRVPLPLTTRMLLAVSAYLQHWGIVTLFGIIALVACYILLRKKFFAVRYVSDWAVLYIPLVGMLSRTYNLTNFTRTLGLLLKSGVHLTEALGITAETTGNLLYKEAYLQAQTCVTKGEQLSRHLMRREDLFPAMLAHMVYIGETTGNLSSTLTYLSESYEAEVDEQTKNLSSSIEPVLMIMMGILVGLIAVSVITPIYEITQHLNPRH